MMNGYAIDEQTEGRGENAKTVFIKAITKCPATDKTGKMTGLFPLKSAASTLNPETGKWERNTLPCLKVKLSNPLFSDHRFEVRWSNYYEQISTTPGKFKLVRVDLNEPVFLYDTDAGNGRKIINRKTGKPQVDYVAMAMQFGSEPIWSDEKYPKLIGWSWGEKQSFKEESFEMWETETFDEAESKLTERFGDDLANEILLLFVGHEEFSRFLPAAVAVAVAA